MWGRWEYKHLLADFVPEEGANGVNAGHEVDLHIRIIIVDRGNSFLQEHQIHREENQLLHA